MRKNVLLILALSTYGALIGLLLKSSPTKALYTFVGFIIVGLISSKFQNKKMLKVPLMSFAIVTLLALYFYLELEPLLIFNLMYIVCMQRFFMRNVNEV